MYDVWKNALAEIEQQISAANFSTWFQGTSLISNDEGYIKIGVKNTFYVKQLRNRYLDIIKKAGGKLLESTSIFDIYEGSQIPEGKKSVAFSVTLRSLEATLTDEQIDSAVKRILKKLEANGATLRM